MRINHHIKATAALALAFGAISAPPALAGTGSSPVVRPNPDEQTIQAPSANVSPNVLRYNPDQQAAANRETSTSPGSEVIDNGGYGFANVPPPIVHVSAASGGFDWGDAGIGAAGGFALSMLALGGALAVTHGRRERPGRSSPRAAG